MKKLALAACLLAGTSVAVSAADDAPLASHNLKIVTEHRDHFSRDYMELGSNFGMVGPGLLTTTLEYHTWAKDDSKVLGGEERINSVDSFYAPGFMYFLPVTQSVFVGPAAKFQVDDGHRSYLKSGVAGMYNPGNGFYAFAMYRLDRNLKSDISGEGYDAADVDRKDVLMGYNNGQWDLNLRVSHFHFVKDETRALAKSIGHKAEFAEAELIAEYKGYKNFSPYVAAIWESKDEYMNPTAYGKNGFALGLKLHF